MLRGLASRCVSPRGNSSSNRYAAIWHGTLVANQRRSFAERHRRSGDGRKKNWFEERSAASQEEYFRRETARQLKEIRERGVKRKAEPEGQAEFERQEKLRKEEIEAGEPNTAKDPK